MTHRLINADCLEYLRTRPAEKIHSVVCDPPYGLSSEPNIEEVLTKWLAGEDYEHRGGGFMGKDWDSFVPGPAVWREVFRVLKPGGHALVFSSSRTFDLMTIALRIAGFEIRDELMWINGQGMPKSHNIGKAIDKLLGHTRDRVESTGGIPSGSNQLVQSEGQNARATDKVSDVPISDEAAEWNGWGTTLKPMHEPIIVARKPLEGKLLASGERSSKSTITLAENVLRHGVGGYNIGGTLLPTADNLNGGTYSPGGRGDGVLNPGNPNGWGDATGMFAEGKGRMPGKFVQPPGRHPGNVILTHHDACVVTGDTVVIAGDSRVGQEPEGTRPGGFVDTGAPVGTGKPNGAVHGPTEQAVHLCHPDCPVRMLDAQAKGVSRFFYVPKASRKERDAGLEQFAAAFAPTMGDGIGGRPHNAGAKGALVKNTHPTVKPIELMQWLCRLVTPPNGVVLDPFMGSGTTGIAALLEGFNFVGIEREPEYAAIANARIAHWLELGELAPVAIGPGANLPVIEATPVADQVAQQVAEAGFVPEAVAAVHADVSQVERTVLAIAGADVVAASEPAGVAS